LVEWGTQEADEKEFEKASHSGTKKRYSQSHLPVGFQFEY
jgi:hypothetical protein